MLKENTISEFGKWNRILTYDEIKSLFSEENLELGINIHVALQFEPKKGFWNRLFRKGRWSIYINGIKCVSSDIHFPKTYSFWTK
jgi:hypothetical protein